MASPNHRKVLVAMSGGVDSAVAAALLKQEGHEVVGCFMRLGSEDGPDMDDASSQTPADAPSKPGHQGCCSLNDACDARLVAAILDVPLYVLNFKPQFDRIIDYFVGEYNAGRTPNPCIRCNNWLKFGRLVSYARSIDADFVATGHYARVDHHNGQSRLRRAVDRHKDQSYVLFGTPRQTLKQMLLPVGQYHKARIRQIARQMGLPVFDKPDSQEICFVPDNNYMRLVAERTPDQVQAGPIVDREGRQLGTHGGHQGFTIGQRRGLSVSLGHPIYVVDKDAATNTIMVGTSKHTEAPGLVASETNWLVDMPPDQPVRCQVNIRSNGAAVAATAWATCPDTLKVLFDEPQRAVSAGQAVVCYHGDTALGGGWIDRTMDDEQAMAARSARDRSTTAGTPPCLD